jgi:hypothetical protein
MPAQPSNGFLATQPPPNWAKCVGGPVDLSTQTVFKLLSLHHMTEKLLYIDGYPLFIDFGFDIFSKSGKYC